MKEVLQFIFSSFWVFVGTLILIAVIGEALTGIVKITINKKKSDE